MKPRRYNSMSDAGSLAARAKRYFHKQYPDVRVGINAMEGWIEVEGKKAVNMSSASSRPMSLEDVVDKMKQAYLGHPTHEGKLRITKGQLRKIIREVILIEAEDSGDQAYVGPYVVAGTEAKPGSSDEDEQMCNQLGSELISLHKQLQAPGADVQSIQKQIALTTKTQAQTCEK
jgi:hypothetical protein